MVVFIIQLSREDIRLILKPKSEYISNVLEFTIDTLRFALHFNLKNGSAEQNTTTSDDGNKKFKVDGGPNRVTGGGVRIGMRDIKYY